ncbi:MAG: VOC family protein [Caldilineaceae bacterium]|nr:VOC family protein [Caldilineaceae bacterium]
MQATSFGQHSSEAVPQRSNTTQRRKPCQNALNWFEIPVTDLHRAVKFYSAIYDTKLVPQDTMPGYDAAFFPAESDGVGGAIVQGEGYVPATEGTLVYLSGGDNLSTILDRVEGAGGKVIMPKSGIGDNGFIGLFIDSEGNKVGLHSMG